MLLHAVTTKLPSRPRLLFHFRTAMLIVQLPHGGGPPCASPPALTTSTPSVADAQSALVADGTAPAPRDTYTDGLPADGDTTSVHAGFAPLGSDTDTV